jgi:hypothetical protein
MHGISLYEFPEMQPGTVMVIHTWSINKNSNYMELDLGRLTKIMQT